MARIKLLLAVLLLAVVAAPCAAEDVCSVQASQRSCKRQRKAGCRFTKASNSCTLTPNVLFVGNSFTSAKSKLDTVFRSLSRSGGKLVDTLKRTSGGYTIRRHWDDGVVARMIENNVRSNGFIVLQEQSQHLQYSFSTWGTLTEPYVEKFKELADAEGKELLLFETWGYYEGDTTYRNPDSYEAMQTRISSGYASLGQRTQVRVCPAGHVWRRAIEWYKNNGKDWKPMYGDIKHQSAFGHYAVACAFYACIWGESPEGISYKPKSMSRELASLMQTWAAEEVLNT